MTRVKVLPMKLVGLIRYKCTCGHCQDVPGDKRAERGEESSAFVLPGFTEIP